MANVFISYDHGNQQDVDSFRALKNNPNHELDFKDLSLAASVTGADGNAIRKLPGEPGSEPVQRELLRLFERSNKLLVLIGNNTHQSHWVHWEITNFYKRRLAMEPERHAKNRIMGMRLNQHPNAKAPDALVSITPHIISWNVRECLQWLERNPNAW